MLTNLDKETQISEIWKALVGIDPATALSYAYTFNDSTNLKTYRANFSFP